MSKLLQRHNGIEEVVEIYTNLDSHLATFHSLRCDHHGDGLHITDQFGSDFCIECIKQMLDEARSS